MGSSKGLLYAMGALGISTTAYFFSRPKPLPKSTVKLHGAENCKYILDNSYSHIYTLPDGRELGYADYGDPKGKPILYQHGIPGSRIEATRYHDLGKELGLRIIAIDRPGYGWSAPFSRYRGRTVKSWAEDINALADNLQLTEYAVLGISGGGPYALSLAYGLPKDRLKAVSLVCGIGPTDIGMSGATWPTYLGFTGGWRWSPQIFVKWFFQRDAADSPELSGEDRLQMFLCEDRLKGLNEKDRSFFADEDEMRTYIAASKQSFAQGFDAMCKDGFVICTDWGFQIEDIRKDLPVVLWYGEKDVSVPPNHGRAIAQRLRTEDEQKDGENGVGRVKLRMLDDTHASISMRDKRGYLVDILEAWEK